MNKYIIKYSEYVLLVDLITLNIEDIHDYRCNTCFDSSYCNLTVLLFILRHVTVNGCITPLYYVHGCAVTTVEGIGTPRDGLHPVQVSPSQVSRQPTSMIKF